MAEPVSLKGRGRDGEACLFERKGQDGEACRLERLPVTFSITFLRNGMTPAPVYPGREDRKSGLPGSEGQEIRFIRAGRTENPVYPGWEDRKDTEGRKCQMK